MIKLTPRHLLQWLGTHRHVRKSTSEKKLINTLYERSSSTFFSSKPNVLKSVVLGSFADPLTYVIHHLDSHLTFAQTFQICSLFGRVRILGFDLQPLTFYTVSNYRTNSLLAIELKSSSTTTTSIEQIQSLIPIDQLAQTAFENVEEKNGDIILIRQDPTINPFFFRILREHQFYNQIFSERYPNSQKTPWEQLEKDLYIRLNETNEQTTIVPREDFVQTTDHIINRWLNETTNDVPFVVLMCGEKDLGKSTFTRYLVNRALNHVDSTYNLNYFDCDIGQCEFTISGCLSFVNIHSPLLGPPCSHIRSNPKPDRFVYYGLNSPQTAPVRYLQSIDMLRRLWNIDREVDKKKSLVLINTMGWVADLGLELLKETICMCSPNVIIQLTDSSSQMSDISVSWLMKQPVYTAYRKTISMNDKRRDDYDGKINYELIKIQSAAVNSSAKKSKLRPRDHRLLATWSYFFTSKSYRIQLSWSDVLHTSSMKNCEPHSIVAFCTSEYLELLKSSAIAMNGIFYIPNKEYEIFECLGFGWIESCDTQNQTYEIYTPITNLPTTTILVSGTVDIPNEFASIFKRICS